jgi:hypothetical protein
MMLEPITTFTLAAHDGAYEDWPLRTPLLADGALTRTTVPGYVIDGQYRCDDGYLLITSWDCPFEESYDFLLLSDDFTQLSRASLGVPYGTYLLHAHWPIDERSVRLHFQTTLFYTLSIRPPGRLRRRPHLTLEQEIQTPTDDRSLASVIELEQSLAAIRATLERGADAPA